MKITTNTSEVLLQLQNYKKEVERKLTEAVIRFSYYIVLTATEFTPIGDAEKFYKSYQNRFNQTGLRPEEGLARAGWQANTNGSFDFRQDYGQHTGIDAANEAESSMMNSYVLGDKIYIGNKGPYIQELEDDYSYQTHAQGIVKPTIAEIVSIYSADFKHMYDNA